MKKYLNKYRIESARLPHWDYGNPALYFITICTKNRIRYFGEIVAVETPCMASLPPQQMHLSEIGLIAEHEWLKTFELRRDMNLYMGEFVVMPDHFHAIIGIGDNPYNISPRRRDAMHGVSTAGAGHGVNVAAQPINNFGPQSKNLASVVRGFKSAVTTAARRINLPFQWQTRYHEHIIQNDREHRNISQYILLNPIRYERDDIM